MSPCRYRARRSSISLYIVIALITFPASEPQVRVNKNVFAWSETTVTMLCMAETKQSVTQITWQRKLNGKVEYFLTYNKGAEPRLLTPFAKSRVKLLSNEDKDGSIEVQNVTLADEGLYICIFTTFPDGATEAKINLHIWVAPVVHVVLKPVVASQCQEVVAECQAASAKPNATIEWDTGGITFSAEENATRESYGTVSKVSALRMTPALELHGQEVICLVHQPDIPITDQKHVTVNVTLTNIHYAPQTVYTEVLRKEDGGLQLRCQSDSFPPAKYMWKRKNISISKNGSEETSGTVNVYKINEDINGLYICEAENAVGVNRGSVYLYQDTRRCHTLPLFLFWLSLMIIGFLFLIWLRKSERSPFKSGKEKSEGKIDRSDYMQQPDVDSSPERQYRKKYDQTSDIDD